MRKIVPEKGKMTINGHEMSWEIIRSKTTSVFGINQSRIFELNIYRDGTLTADYNKKWLRVPYIEDEETTLCLNEILSKYGQEKPVKTRKGDNGNE